MSVEVVRQHAETGTTSRGPTADEDNMQVVAIQRDTVTDPSSSTPYVDDDMNMLFETAATVKTEWQIATTCFPENPCTGIDTLNPEIATIDSNGFTTYVSDGVAVFVLKSRMGNRTLRLEHSIVGGEDATVFDSWVTGSLAQVTSDAVDGAINGKDPSATKPIFTIQDHGNGPDGTYERNDLCWANPWRQQLTCISPWNSNLGKYQAGTAITPRHIIFAEHWQIPDGTELRFITSDNVVVKRTMVSRMQVGNSDFMIGLLDSDLPASITPCKMMADEVATKLPNLSRGIPSLRLDQEEKAIVCDWAEYRIFDFMGAPYGSNITIAPSDATRLSFYESGVRYDSGNPDLIPINGDLVLLFTLQSSSSGPAAQFFLTEIQSTIDTLGAFGHTVAIVPLAPFPSY